ncbi:MAG: efflux RND transporter periplasmic adaptor subunit, partial [Planctomycetota bacterium JB042]
DVSTDIEAEQVVTVFPKVGNAYVAELLVDEGDSVTLGQPLALLDRVDFEIEVKRREAALAQRKLAEKQAALQLKETIAREDAQRAMFERARSDYERAQAAIADGVDVFSVKELTDVEKSYQQAVAELEALRLTKQRTESEGELAKLETEAAAIELEAARNDLDHTTIRSPISGTVRDRTVDKGLLVTSASQLFTLVDPTRLVANLRIPQEDLLVVTGPGLPVEFAFDALPGRVFHGEVEAINPSIDPASGLIKVRVRLAPEAVGVVRPGMYARARIIVSSQDDAVLLSKRAVVYEDGRSTFFSVEDGVARRHQFVPGASTEDDVEVRSIDGVPLDGDAPEAARLGALEVILVGQDRLQDGDPVRVAPESA